MNRFQRLLIRWEKKSENYLALLQLASAFITVRSVEIVGQAPIAPGAGVDSRAPAHGWSALKEWR